jgi:hypothetical protein
MFDYKAIYIGIKTKINADKEHLYLKKNKGYNSD